MDAYELICDTASKAIDTVIQFIPGSGNHAQETLYPTPLQSPHAASSPSQLPLPPSPPPESHEPPAHNDLSVPSNSTSFVSSDTDGAPCSTSTSATSIKSVPVPTAQSNSLDVGLANSLHQCQINHSVQTTLARLPTKPHIYQRQHETRVRETRKQDRQKMLEELHEIKRKQGFTSNIESLESLLGYEEKLRRRGVTPSQSWSDLREKKRLPVRPRRRSHGEERVDGHELVSLEVLKRALEKAKSTLAAPPPPPLLSRHERLREAARKKDDAINRLLRPPLPKVLPPEIETEVNVILRKRGIISKIAREQVSDKDISRLQPCQWLNDEIINFYGAMILSRSELFRHKPPLNGTKKSKILDVHYFSSFFWTKLLGEGYERARLAKWTKKFDIFAKDIILIPINHDNMHWTGAAINFREKRIESYDSMNVPRKLVFHKLRQYLDLEHRNKKGKPFDFTDWIDYDPEDTPQQENGYDCGVFTCQFLESLSRGEECFNFSQRDMTYLRRRMIWEIAHAEFLDWR